MRLPSDLTNLLDRAVIAWILDGSAEARDKLRRRYQARVYNAILKLVREPHTASDLTDLSFKKVFKKLGTFKQELPFAPWIFTIANNNVMDHFEKERRETQARDEWLWETTPGKRLREGVPAIDQTPSDPELNVPRSARRTTRPRPRSTGPTSPASSSITSRSNPTTRLPGSSTSRPRPSRAPTPTAPRPTSGRCSAR